VEAIVMDKYQLDNLIRDLKDFEREYHYDLPLSGIMEIESTIQTIELMRDTEEER
jgi:hypothetical protein